MTHRKLVAWLVPAALAILACGPPAASLHAQAADCSLGRLRLQRTLIVPHAGTPYSVDALNPDVVQWRERFLMYFSGNDVASSASTNSQWSTELAVADRPTGPFRITAFHAHYLNGGTTVWRGQLWHLVEVNQGYTSDLAVSTDGVHWRHVAWFPSFRIAGRPAGGADFSLGVANGQLVIYMFIVYHPLSSTRMLGQIMFDGRRFHGFRPILTAQNPDTDVGEPYPFTVNGRRRLLYVVTAAHNIRSIAEAVFRRGRWMPCGVEITGGAPWASLVAIDPNVITLRGRAYIFYGGGPTPGLGSDLHGEIGVDEYTVG